MSYQEKGDEMGKIANLYIEAEEDFLQRIHAEKPALILDATRWLDEENTTLTLDATRLWRLYETHKKDATAVFTVASKTKTPEKEVF